MPICGDGIGVNKTTDWCDEGSSPVGCNSKCDGLKGTKNCTEATLTSPSVCETDESEADLKTNETFEKVNDAHKYTSIVS